MKELKIVHLRGTQAEMGAQYAKIVRDHGGWEETAAAFPKIAESLLADANAHTAQGRLMTAVIKGLMSWGGRRLESRRPRSYRERSEAYTAGLGLPPELARQYMLMDLFQNVVGVAGRYRLGPFARKHGLMPIPACSSLLVWGDASEEGVLRHARNFDFTASGIWEKEPTVVFCTPDEGLRYGYVGSFGIDVPGITGFNEAGLALTAHTRFHRDVSFSGAGIVDLCHDIIRRAETLDDAVKVAQERPVASTWGLAVSSARDGEGLIIETTAKRTVVIRPQPSRDFVTATNLYRHPDTQDGQLAPSPAFSQHCDGRESRLRALATAACEQGGLSRQHLEAALGDHADPFSPGTSRAAGACVSQSVTVQSVVFDMAAASVSVSVGDCPTGWGPYAQVPLEWDAQVGLQVLEVDEKIGRSGSGFDEGPEGEAFDLWLEATRLDLLHHDSQAIRPLLQEAVRLAPSTPSYRFILGTMDLRAGDFEGAFEQFTQGLAAEASLFRRAQFLLWSSRTAHVLGNVDEAKRLRAELRLIDAPHVEELHAMAAADERRSPSASKLRKVCYNMMLVDAL